MKVLDFRSVGTLALVALLVAMSSCAHDQRLVAITIQPTTVTFGDSNIPVAADLGLAIQLRALGTYIHPAVTKDITNQVTWASDDIQDVTVNSTGLLAATGQGCETGALISATVQTNNSGSRTSSGAIVTSNMTANVVCFTGTSGAPILTVTFLGSGSGTVTFTPSNFICASNCSVAFASGTPVSITAAASGTFVGWQFCDSVSGPSNTVCNITSLTANRGVTVTFN